ncbi:MAG: hypothetical protein K2K40_06085 [Paramuribaculum sp.]|nr:hypothetical protein [Paramuribaculum sp.]
MKTFAFVIFSVLLLFVGLAACGGDRDIERQLDRADAMMDSIPAEALTILQEIDRSCLGDADAARHALLLSQAYDKTAVTDADGAVIATAVAELSAGLTVMLPGGVTPGMTLRATIG